VEDNEKGAEGEVVVDLVGSKEVDEVDVIADGRKEVDVNEEVFDEVERCRCDREKKSM
jgi:hypothetical protein